MLARRQGQAGHEALEDPVFGARRVHREHADAIDEELQRRGLAVSTARPPGREVVLIEAHADQPEVDGRADERLAVDRGDHRGVARAGRRIDARDALHRDGDARGRRAVPVRGRQRVDGRRLQRHVLAGPRHGPDAVIERQGIRPRHRPRERGGSTARGKRHRVGREGADDRQTADRSTPAGGSSGSRAAACARHSAHASRSALPARAAGPRPARTALPRGAGRPCPTAGSTTGAALSADGPASAATRPARAALPGGTRGSGAGRTALSSGAHAPGHTRGPVGGGIVVPRRATREGRRRRDEENEQEPREKEGERFHRCRHHRG